MFKKILSSSDLCYCHCAFSSSPLHLFLSPSPCFSHGFLPSGPIVTVTAGDIASPQQCYVNHTVPLAGFNSAMQGYGEPLPGGKLNHSRKKHLLSTSGCGNLLPSKIQLWSNNFWKKWPYYVRECIHTLNWNEGHPASCGSVSTENSFQLFNSPLFSLACFWSFPLTWCQCCFPCLCLYAFCWELK